MSIRNSEKDKTIYSLPFQTFPAFLSPFFVHSPAPSLEDCLQSGRYRCLDQTTWEDHQEYPWHADRKTYDICKECKNQSNNGHNANKSPVINAHLGLKKALSLSFFKWINDGNSSIMLRPSSIIGEWQNEHRTLQGSLCSTDLDVGSYHSRLWWPSEKLISSLWKMAAHWNGAALYFNISLSSSRPDYFTFRLLTMLRLAGRAMAQLRIKWLFTTKLIFHFATMTTCIVEGIELVVRFVNSVGSALLPLLYLRRMLTTCLLLIHFEWNTGWI